MKTSYEIVAAQEWQHRGAPHGWIQWKGTDVCMDVHCKCGHMSHIDSDFVYAVRCPMCGQAYGVGMNIPLIPLSKDEEKVFGIIEVADQ